MRKSFIQVFFIALLSIFLTVPQVSAEVITGHDPHHEKVRGQDGNGELAEEALVTVNLPISLVKRELRNILVSDGSPITKLDRLEFDAIERLIMIEGDLEVPSDIMHDLEVPAGGNDLKEKLYMLVSKIESMNLENDVQYYTNFKEKMLYIRMRIITPLYGLYEARYMEHNRSIIEKGPTDWNYTYFPDAIYSDSVYRQVSNLLLER